MATSRPKYARYAMRPVRPLGAGAFFDFAAAATKRQAGELKSCSLSRRSNWMRRVASGAWAGPEGAIMEWERIAANWAHYKQSAKRRWARITEAQLDAIAGRRGQLAAQIREVYGISASAAQMQLESWQGVQVEP